MRRAAQAKNTKSRKPKKPAERRGPDGLNKIARTLPHVTKKAFQKFGFASHDIADHWLVIIGEEISEFTSPERIRWPRRDQANAVLDDGVLVIRVDGPRAIEIQHRTPEIIERVNRYFGFHAIGRLKLVQGPLPKRNKGPLPKRKKDALPKRNKGPLPERDKDPLPNRSQNGQLSGTGSKTQAVDAGAASVPASQNRHNPLKLSVRLEEGSLKDALERLGRGVFANRDKAV